MSEKKDWAWDRIIRPWGRRYLSVDRPMSAWIALPPLWDLYG